MWTHFDLYFGNQVLNAGKNKLKSMDDVQSLVGLRALILNGEIFRLFLLYTLSWLFEANGKNFGLCSFICVTFCR